MPHDPQRILTDEDIQEFCAIIREDYGVELTPEQARQESEALIRFAYLLSRPIKPKASTAKSSDCAEPSTDREAPQST